MLSAKRGPIPTALLLTAASEFVLAASPPTATSARFASPHGTPIMSPLREQYGLCSPVATPVTAFAPRFSVPLNTPATAHWKTTTFFDSEDTIKEEDETEAAAAPVLPEDDAKPSKWKGIDFSDFPGIAQAANFVKRTSTIVIDQEADDILNRKLLVEGADGQKVQYPRSPYPSFAGWELPDDAVDREADDILRNNLHLQERAVSPRMML
ncbi:unnamed protein product [Clonostachys rosea f. rosea IK726]|uniref:Uncharacterized protein n=1 Tax=Clonostachys rosea f. rosea IK726 TaxID=1349383 RepID=A0ACA9TXP2_BIOOC|nr:unnamed protein product [Clonostachys rosea f. rosea IK726]